VGVDLTTPARKGANFSLLALTGSDTKDEKDAKDRKETNSFLPFRLCRPSRPWLFIWLAVLTLSAR
jgi:hypothetical protein